MIKQHQGQHGDDCYACKLATLNFGNDQPKTHVVDGNPWKNNPVVERMEELHRLAGNPIELNTDVPRPPGAPK